MKLTEIDLKFLVSFRSFQSPWYFLSSSQVSVICTPFLSSQPPAINTKQLFLDANLNVPVSIKDDLLFYVISSQSVVLRQEVSPENLYRNTDSGLLQTCCIRNCEVGPGHLPCRGLGMLSSEDPTLKAFIILLLLLMNSPETKEKTGSA